MVVNLQCTLLTAKVCPSVKWVWSNECVYVSVHVQPATFTTGIDNISWWSDFTGWSYCAGCKVYLWPV